jgi:glycosyltransferase involved in cell wall biosynthesis
MRAPVLKELPPPPPDKTSWPWTEETLAEPSPIECYPRISIVTPSFNQGPFLEETIRSVLLQGYPDLEYIIIDGGSTDGSIDIIRKYEPWLAHWISEPDEGQTDAINKGMRKSSGDILAWLNSDDVYCPGALEQVGRYFSKSAGIDLLYGDCEMIDSSGSLFGRFNVGKGGPMDLLKGNFIAQPSTFCTRGAWQEVGGPDENLHYIMDYDLWLRMFLKGMSTLYVPTTFSRFRYHDTSKSGVMSIQFGYECLRMLDKIDKSKDRVLLPALLQAYHQTFETIIGLYEQTTTDNQTLQNAITKLLDLWISHIERYFSNYISVPRLLAQSYYSIGNHYCLIKYMKEGRKFFAKAFQINGGFNSRGLLAWAMTFLGKGPFKWNQKRIRALETG